MDLLQEDAPQISRIDASPLLITLQELIDSARVTSERIFRPIVLDDVHMGGSGVQAESTTSHLDGRTLRPRTDEDRLKGRLIESLSENCDVNENIISSLAEIIEDLISGTRSRDERCTNTSLLQQFRAGVGIGNGEEVDHRLAPFVSILQIGSRYILWSPLLIENPLLEGGEVALSDQLADTSILDHLLETQLRPIGSVGRCGESDDHFWLDYSVKEGAAGTSVMLTLVNYHRSAVSEFLRITGKHGDGLDVVDLEEVVVGVHRLVEQFATVRNPPDFVAFHFFKPLAESHPHHSLAGTGRTLDQESVGNSILLAFEVIDALGVNAFLIVSGLESLSH